MSQKTFPILPATGPIFDYFGKLRRVRRGSRFSRAFRYIFEHNLIKPFIGTNIAALMLASTFLPSNPSDFYESSEAEFATIAVQEIIIETKRNLANPVGEMKLTQGYNIFHRGLDIDGVTGDLVNPIMKGQVSKVEYSSYGYGNSIYVDHGAGISSLYAHLSKIEVNEGEKVTTESKIGEMGSTGRSTGDHLHLEVYKDGVAINPYSILPRE